MIGPVTDRTPPGLGAPPAWAWALAGLVAGLAGVAASHAAAMALTLRESPLISVGQGVIRLTPGMVADGAIGVLGAGAKVLLVAVIVALLPLLFALAGLLARRSLWWSALVFTALGAVGVAAAVTAPGAGTVDLLPVVAGVAVWVVVFPLLTGPLRHLARWAAEPRSAPAEPHRHRTRRGFLVGAGLTAAAAVVLGAGGQLLGRQRRRVDQVRRLLRLPVTRPVLPAGARLDVEGITPWQTPTDRFYKIQTALVPPAIDPGDWSLRIHGRVEEEVTLTYQQLLALGLTESWVTLNCVSNPVGGPLIGNAWWSGVRTADVLALAGVQDGADGVLQTSDDGWTCLTPLDALTDDRGALLAVAMNGEPLPIDHGFPVRTVVPGLYGYVSATKWVVDWKVTRFDDDEGYWTSRGWGVRGPVRIGSRIDLPADGSTSATRTVTAAGLAWFQGTGLSGVQVSLDGGGWQDAEVGASGRADELVDAWAQWRVVLDAAPGQHRLRVRAVAADGTPQTGEQRDVLPDGATGWHQVDFEVSDDADQPDDGADAG